MIIKKLTLFNFGIYRNLHTFSFMADKPVVLIGALNGCGKTTFLEAILFALYGENSQAFQESDYSTIGNYLRGRSNNDSENSECFIELEFSLDTEKDNSTFKVKRSWDSSKTRIAPQIEVYKNDRLDRDLTHNWAMYVEDIIPSALSGFFFFDGEKIAELVDRNADDEQMKSSIKSLLGIDVVDSLQSDINKLSSRIRKRTNSTCSRDSIDMLAKKKADFSQLLIDTDKKILSATEAIDNLKKEREKKYIEHAISGGQIINNLEYLYEKQQTLQNKILEVNEEFIHLAATGFPLLMVKPLIEKARISIEEEYDTVVLKAALSKIEQILNPFIKESSGSEAQNILEYLQQTISANQGKTVFNPDANTIGQIDYLLSFVFAESEQRYVTLSQRKNELQNELEVLNGVLNTDVNTELAKEIKAKIDLIDEQIEKNEMDIRFLSTQRPSINGELIRCQAEYRRAVDDYLSSQDMIEADSRACAYIDKSNQVLDKYRVKLQAAKVEKLSRDITQCFSLLSRKKDLISRVIVNSETLDFHYYGIDGNEIKQSILSAGERQLIVISTLWALSLNSKEQLPVIIDTPLARLDTVHRTALVKTYFPNASKQTIILSTDTEVTGECYDLLRPNISDEYTLIYDANKRSTVIVEGYLYKEHQ